MSWFLMVYVAGFTQFQVMGSWPEEGQCKIAKAAIEHAFKKSSVACIPAPLPNQPQQPKP